ncbi:uncharacterized protein [Dermacentor albipictus]|uniref:uncharacterized protein n=1 Tax=Dermacentor albipictus TaxID=60249 RepID=UPI0031FE26CE
MLSQAAQNWQHDDRCYNKLVELLHKGTYKKTEAGLSVDFRKIVDTKLSDESLQTEYDKKIVHYGLHYMKSVNSLTDFKQKAVNYMKSVREFHKKVNPERTAKEALDPLYGFISMQMRPYDPSKPQETFELAQGVEDALGYPLLFIMHTNAERPFEDSAMCVLGGTPLAVPAACKMPSLTDYLKLIKTFKFKHESNTAATFDVALMSFDVQEDIKPDSKLTSLSGTTDEAGIRSRHELCEASNYPTLLPVDDVLKVEAQAKEKKVVVYDSESTWKTKLEKFNQQSTGPHLGHAVFYLEYASQDCDGEQTHPQLKKFQELTGIRRK